VAKVNAERRQVRHRNLSIGEHKLPPPIRSVSQAGGHSMVINADNFHAMPTLTNGRHHVTSPILASTNMPSVANAMNGVGCDCAGIGNVQAALGSQSPIGNNCAGDRFLNSVFALPNGKATELDLGVCLDGWENLQKTFLPR